MNTQARPLTLVIAHGPANTAMLPSLVAQVKGAQIQVATIVVNARALESLTPWVGADAVIFTHDLPGITPELIQELLQQPDHPIAAVGIFPAGTALTIARYHAAGMKGCLTLPLEDPQLQALPDLIHQAVDTAWNERIAAQAQFAVAA
jgi:CheY-like chemotaxis protein